MSTGKKSAGIAGRIIKQKVQSNRNAPFTARFFNALWTYRIGQLTTSNVRRLKEAAIPMSYGSGGDAGISYKNNASSRNDDQIGSGHDDLEGDPVKSDLQPYAMHKFTGDDAWSLVVAVPKNSEHFRNIIECSRGSLMVGHTDPQLFHWFKQLGTLPPRAVISGPLELLSGDMQREAWEQTFIRHPVIHSLAQDMWERKDSKTEEETVAIERREREEDEKRMRRMSSSDWRAKFKERERNPTAEEDEERPIYVVKPDTFALLRLRLEVKLWMNVVSQTQRVWEPKIADPDPLCRCAPRFLRMLNLARQKLVPSLNMNFALKLTNAFIFEIDKKGMWAMGTQERLDEGLNSNNAVREEWMELRLEFGKDQVIQTEQEMEWWVRGLTKLGAPEISQSNSSVEDAGMNPEDYDYRHI